MRKQGALVGPGSKTWDMGFFKNFPFGERYRIQARAEFFNTLNRVNLGNPSSSVSAGAPSEASPARAIPGLVNWP